MRMYIYYMVSSVTGVGSSELRKEIYYSKMFLTLPRELTIVAVAALILFVIALIVTVFVIRLKLKNRTLQKERFELQCCQMEREMESLTELLQRSERADAMKGNAPTVKVLHNRVEMLNRFFMASIIDSPAEYKKAQRELEALIANRKMFMDSTRAAFAESHPEFIAVLQEHGLNEREVHYCCLTALGLTGKEIGDYIGSRSHYNLALNIRRLGLTDQHIKLSTYISQLLNETPENLPTEHQ